MSYGHLCIDQNAAWIFIVTQFWQDVCAASDVRTCHLAAIRISKKEECLPSERPHTSVVLVSRIHGDLQPKFAQLDSGAGGK